MEAEDKAVNKVPLPMTKGFLAGLVVAIVIAGVAVAGPLEDAQAG